MRLSLWICLGLLAACAIDVAGSVPGRVSPGFGDAADLRTVAAARDVAERGEPVRALRLLEPVRSADEPVVEAERLRQDILRRRGRLGLLRAEADRRVEAAPESAIAHYLHGRLQPTTATMAASFRRAAELDPASMWPWLGLAYSLRVDDPEESLSIYGRLFEASQGQLPVAVAYASALRSSGRLREAAAVYERMLAEADTAGVGHLGLAQVLFALGGNEERKKGWASLLSAVRERPFDPGVHGVLRELLRLGIADEQVEQCVDVLREDPECWAGFGSGQGGELLGTMLVRLRQPLAALAVLESTDDGAHRPELARLRRQLTLATGDARGFLEHLRRDVPPELLLDESNQVRARWQTLLQGGWDEGDQLADATRAAGFVSALRDVGLLEEAETAAGIALARAGAAVPQTLRAVADEVRAEIAFQNALRQVVYRGYAEDADVDLSAVLAEVSRASRRILGRDVVAPDRRFQVPLVGEMLDPFAAGLCLHLARYNKHLVLGRRAGGVPEGLLFTRLSLRDLPTDETLPLPGRCREVVGIDRSVRSLSGVLGGDLAGIALLNHYVVDHDAVVEWAAAIDARRRIAMEDGNALLQDPVPADTGPLDPLDVSWRLAAVSSMRDTDLRSAVLEVIRLHERRHLVDSFHYLPIESNLWRGLGLLLRFGLSSDAVEAEMERRAELAALAGAARPEIVLAHIAEFAAEEDEGSPHVRGFTELARDLRGALVRQGVPEADTALARWHRLDLEVVRRAALDLLRELP